LGIDQNTSVPIIGIMKPKKKKPGPPKGKGKDPMHSLRVPNEEWEHWQTVAESEGLSLTAWMRKILNRAAKRATNK
jgi:hypothetical protein